jgi:hypothetical protein
MGRGIFNLVVLSRELLYSLLLFWNVTPRFNLLAFLIVYDGRGIGLI